VTLDRTDAGRHRPVAASPRALAPVDTVALDPPPNAWG
jgi:hypothetical protein